MNKLSPSILSCDFSRLGEQVRIAEQAGADYLHLDVMDGNFVPNISFGIPVIESLRKVSNMVFDVHLMIAEPELFIEKFAHAGADIITVHAEATAHLHRAVQQIKETGRRAGVALNPSTPLDVVEYVLDDVDMILLMTVNPGFGGQKYIPAMTEKIRRLKKMLDGRPVELEIDGGVGLNNLKETLDAGANVIVAGSAVFGQEDIAAAVADFKEQMGNE